MVVDANLWAVVSFYASFAVVESFDVEWWFVSCRSHSESSNKSRKTILAFCEFLNRQLKQQSAPPVSTPQCLHFMVSPYVFDRAGFEPAWGRLCSSASRLFVSDFTSSDKLFKFLESFDFGFNYFREAWKPEHLSEVMEGYLGELLMICKGMCAAFVTVCAYCLWSCFNVSVRFVVCHLSIYIS